MTGKDKNNSRHFKKTEKLPTPKEKRHCKFDPFTGNKRKRAH